MEFKVLRDYAEKEWKRKIYRKPPYMGETKERERRNIKLGYRERSSGGNATEVWRELGNPWGQSISPQPKTYARQKSLGATGRLDISPPSVKLRVIAPDDMGCESRWYDRV